MYRKNRTAFTLVEMLVVIAVIGMLMALLLPAVQQAREASRRTRCENNLKQVGEAFQTYHDAYGRYPGGTTGSMFALYLLPYLEQQPLYSKWNMKFTATGCPENLAVAQTPVDVFMCPSAPNQPRQGPLDSAGTAYGATADYFVSHMGWTKADGTPVNPVMSNVSAKFSTATALIPSLRKVTDGTSQTIIVRELAGRPEHYILGVRQTGAVSTTDPTSRIVTYFPFRAAWANSGGLSVSIVGYTADGLTPEGTECAINCNNDRGVYSFHPGGANALFCDGSVHLLTTKMSVDTLLSLVSCDGNDVVGAGEF